jgi:hypothetical protein
VKLPYAVIVVVFLISHELCAQQQDSLRISDSLKTEQAKKKKVYSHARRATLMSTFLPGLGQAYNKKYWKIPIIYLGLGGFTYMFVVNNQEYNYYRENLQAINDGDPNTTNTTRYEDWQLKSLKDQYKKSRDLAIVGFFAIYLLNIIDANVDGHLTSFDVSDNLGLRIEPWYHVNPGYAFGRGNAAGLTFKLNFK